MDHEREAWLLVVIRNHLFFVVVVQRDDKCVNCQNSSGNHDENKLRKKRAPVLKYLYGQLDTFGAFCKSTSGNWNFAYSKKLHSSEFSKFDKIINFRLQIYSHLAFKHSLKETKYICRLFIKQKCLWIHAFNDKYH